MTCVSFRPATIKVTSYYKQCLGSLAGYVDVFYRKKYGNGISRVVRVALGKGLEELENGNGLRSEELNVTLEDTVKEWTKNTYNIDVSFFNRAVCLKNNFIDAGCFCGYRRSMGFVLTCALILGIEQLLDEEQENCESRRRYSPQLH